MNGSKNEYLISGFKIWILNDYPGFSDYTIIYLMPFITTYLFKRAFLLYTMTKTKYRNKLNTEHDEATYNSYSRFKHSLSRYEN
jgi:hypothetical protein